VILDVHVHEIQKKSKSLQGLQPELRGSCTPIGVAGIRYAYVVKWHVTWQLALLSCFGGLSFGATREKWKQESLTAKRVHLFPMRREQRGSGCKRMGRVIALHYCALAELVHEPDRIGL
jgi:hypothetical protein